MTLNLNCASFFSVLDEQECKYQCYECAKRFKTSIALQRHLITHEPGAPQPSTSSNESQITPSENHSSENIPESTYSAIKRKYKPQPKKIKVDNSNIYNSMTFHSKCI